MKTTSGPSIVILLLLCTNWGVSRAGEPALKVGDPAPKLQTGKWVQGEPVKQFDKGKAYLVEFWATWCGPCRISIPHLNEIHSRLKERGLVVIGQDCWEQDDKLVEPFVKKMGDKMTYRVALDDKEGSQKGKMAETWMTAAAQNGIPSAFLVDTNGVVAWVGHPMTLTEELIEAVLNGKHDIKKASADFMAAHKENEAAQAARIPVNKFYQALQKKNWDEASASLAEAEKILPKNRIDLLRVQIPMAKRDYPAVADLVERLRNTPEGASALFLNEIAWRMAIDKSISPTDLARAEKIAKWADDASKHHDPMIIDTLARVLFRGDKKADAIALQEKAVGLADEGTKASFEETLASYKNGQLPQAK